jgi:hypothetical protein
MKVVFERLSLQTFRTTRAVVVATEPLIDTPGYLDACDLPRGSSAGFT